MDLVRPLGLAGVRCVVMAYPGAPARYSRFVVARLPYADPWEDPAALVEQLVAFARTQELPPVLMYQGDGDLLAVSRQRGKLAPWFRLVIADADLVEDLVDKGRFLGLAERLGLSVPRAVMIDPAAEPLPRDLGLRFPVVLKPLQRDSARWEPLVGAAKAVRVDSLGDLRERCAVFASAGVPVLAQELVTGPESRVESYHVYVDDTGEVHSEFTGVKIRTRPAEFGHTTALCITRAPDVVVEGRRVIRAIGLHGVAKVDFKRTTSGELLLLEVNPRFTLWHHPAAVAGVNLPALVYADLVGLPRPAPRAARAGVRWCKAWGDLPAARQWGMPLHEWARWAWLTETKRDIAWDDPGPALGAALFFLRGRPRSSGQARRALPRAAG